MRFVILAVAALVVGANAQQYQQEEKYAPIPYQFAYKAESNEGSNSQEETSDGNGRVQGSYSFNLADGRQRTVTYWADDTGFHADVQTNELGTESKDAADAKYSSSAITGEQAAVQYGAQVEQKKVYEAPATIAAPVIKIQSAPTPVVKIQSAPAVVKTYQAAPVIKAYASPAPTVYKTIQAVQAAPTVYKTIQAVHAAPTVYKTIQSAPTVLKTVQAAPISYAYEHAPYQYVASEDYHHVIHKS